MIARIRTSPQFIPALSLVAEVDGPVAGHLLISLETLRHSDGQPTDHAVLMLGHSEYYPRFGFRHELLVTDFDVLRHA